MSIIDVKAGDQACDAASEDLYAKLGKAGLDVIYDDTDDRARAEFATADLMGIPSQLIVGPRSIANGEVN